ncbi:MAG: FG-GAP-like repeat-containing protein, partial [Verrucomicrobiota bacterium]
MNWPVVQSQVVMAGGRYLSGDDPQRTFAAGTGPLTLTVDWPDGWRQVHSHLPPNSRVTVVRDPGAGKRPEPGRPEPEPWFEEVTARLGQVHHEPDHDDFAGQPLLPRKLSQPGPVLAWVDLDRDGWPDLVVGNGSGRAPDRWRNRDGVSFTPFPDPSSIPAGMFTEDVTGLVATSGGAGPEGSPGLLAAFTALETETGSRVVALGGAGGGPVREVLRMDGSLGPLAMGDVNGDGRPDLFAGVRFKPGRYPESAPSALYLAQPDGSLRRDEAQDEALARVGLVRGAVWSDLDGDGRLDLVLACEWGPVRVLLNRGGRLTEVTEAWGLGNHTGWWQAVATGDFDGDGRPDLVASNWGNNSQYQASVDRPVFLFHDDLNRDGTVDLIEAYLEGPEARLVPRRNRVVLGAALPLLRRAIPSHAAFAELDLPGLLRGRQATAGRLQANTLLHSVFLNRGDRFEVLPLPPEAQWSAAGGVGVA